MVGKNEQVVTAPGIDTNKYSLKDKVKEWYPKTKNLMDDSGLTSYQLALLTHPDSKEMVSSLIYGKLPNMDEAQSYKHIMEMYDAGLIEINLTPEAKKGLEAVLEFFKQQ